MGTWQATSATLARLSLQSLQRYLHATFFSCRTCGDAAPRTVKHSMCRIDLVSKRRNLTLTRERSWTIDSAPRESRAHHALCAGGRTPHGTLGKPLERIVQIRSGPHAHSMYGQRFISTTQLLRSCWPIRHFTYPGALPFRSCLRRSTYSPWHKNCKLGVQSMNNSRFFKPQVQIAS